MDTNQGKVNILLQAYISREVLEDFALVSDMAYVAQNGGRIIRALLEIAFSRKWASVATVLMGMSKAVEKRLWPYEHPLRQFELKAETLYRIQEFADEWAVQDLLTLDGASLGELLHLNEQQGQAILKIAKQFPSLQVEPSLRPLGSDVLDISVRLTRNFTWNPKLHGSAEPFWIWVEDHEGLTILQLAHLIVRPVTESTTLEFVLTIPNGVPPPFFTIRAFSDRWIGAEDEIQVSLENLTMPISSQSHTPLLPLPLLPISVIKEPLLAASLSETISTFNAIQTQAYWTFMNTRRHTLLCAPSGNGKSMMIKILALYAQLFPLLKCLIFFFRMATQVAPDFWTVVVTPYQSYAQELYADIQPICSMLNIPLELSSSNRVLSRPKGRLIRIVPASTLLTSLASFDLHKGVVGINLVICDDLEQLDPTYELAVSLLRCATQFQPTRYVGLSNSLDDPADLADWLNVDPMALISFQPRDRDQILNFSIQSFTIPHSASLFKAMAKPAHMSIKVAPSGESAIVFVSSRGLCRSIALNLLTQSMLEMESTRGYLPDGVTNEYIEDRCARLQDVSLADFIGKGVGIFHSGIKRQDRLLILGLFAEGAIRVLIVPHDSIMSLPVRAAVVVVMGTQYIDFAESSSNTGDRQVRDYSLAKIVRMQSHAVRHSSAGHFFLFCQAEAKDTLARFLNDGLPLESELLETPVLVNWMKTQKVDWEQKKQDLVDLLSFSFLSRRVATNPSYYGCLSKDRNENLSRIVDELVEQTSQIALEQ